MAISVNTLKMLATRAIYVKVGADVSKTCAMLLFGGRGVPGIIDEDHLIDAAQEQGDMDTPPKTALAAVMAAAKGSFATKLQLKASAPIATGSLPSEAVDQAIKFIVGDIG